MNEPYFGRALFLKGSQWRDNKFVVRWRLERAVQPAGSQIIVDNLGYLCPVFQG